MKSYTLHIDDAAYPARLRACADAPQVLYGIGDIDANRGHFVAIVGTRRATERSKELTAKLVRELAAQVHDLVIVSGLAYGIDIAAHKAAIDCGVPTVIVPGHGLDRIYPQVHRPVAVQALNAGGAILTEYPEGTEIYGSNFLARNRIIAGLCDCTIVVESMARGGSLTTAKLARQFDRPVFAFPGRPTDVESEGCNILIREGRARLINSAQDVLTAMHWQQDAPVQTSLTFPDIFDSLTPVAGRVLSELRKEEEGIHVNELVQRLDIPYADLSVELMNLELDDLVRSLPGGIYRAIHA